jgi:hypothetical protein
MHHSPFAVFFLSALFLLITAEEQCCEAGFLCPLVFCGSFKSFLDFSLKDKRAGALALHPSAES